MKAFPTLAVFVLAAIGAVHAQSATPMAAMPGTSSAPKSGASFPMSQGEVLKVYPNAVLIRHGPIENMGMDAMTMQFGVPNGKLLKSIRKGDKVRFVVDRADGQFVVTRIERARSAATRR
jgi:Cu(I)/Ag(I) efflux system periplasmic protein CusF